MEKNIKYYYVGIAMFEHEKFVEPLFIKTWPMQILSEGDWGMYNPLSPHVYLDKANELLIGKLKNGNQNILDILGISDEEFYSRAMIYRYHMKEVRMKNNMPIDKNITQKMWNILDEFTKQYRVNVLQNGMEISYRPEERVLPYVSPFERTKGKRK